MCGEEEGLILDSGKERLEYFLDLVYGIPGSFLCQYRGPTLECII